MAELKPVTELQPRRFERVRKLSLHQDCGVSFAAELFGSIDAEKQKAEMTLHPAGVLVKMRGERFLIPFSSIKAMWLFTE